MPVVPEILHINAGERPFEIFRNSDPEEIAGTDRHQAVAREIKEQIDSITVTVPDIFQKALWILKEPNSPVNQSRQNKFI